MSVEAPPEPTRRSTLTDAGNRARLVALGGLTAVTGYIAAVSPEGGRGLLRCPSRTFLGIDCPMCGGMRGTHDLLNGRVTEALGHNILLPLLLAGMAFGLAVWLLPLVGRPTPTIRLPRWAIISLGVVAIGFMVLRNLPVPALEFLASDPVT